MPKTPSVARRARATAALGIFLFAAAAAGATLESAPSVGAGPTSKPKKKILRVLFVGNSLTEANDLPLMVLALARADRRNVVVDSVILAGADLEDHWLDGTALRVLAAQRWQIVVLQQGPSSLPSSRVQLREWTARWAEQIYANGARPALFMVWPGLERNAFFEAVRQSYALAADDVDGIFLPAGEALRIAARLDPTAPLYANDGFHPSVAGTYAAALSIYGTLLGRDPRVLPARFWLADGTLVDIPEELATVLRAAAAEANDEAARRTLRAAPSGSR